MSTMVKNPSSGHGDFATSSVHMFLPAAVARAERVAVAGAEGTRGGGALQRRRRDVKSPQCRYYSFDHLVAATQQK